MKILLWKIGALGDIVMTTPLVRQLRRALPEATIDYLTGQGCTPILAGNPHISQVRGFDASILYRGRVGRLQEVLPLLRGYDCIFTLDKHWIFGMLAWLARPPLRIGFRRSAHEGSFHTHRVRYGAVRHEIAYYLDLAEAAGWPVQRDDIRLEGPAESPFPCDPSSVVLINSGGDNANEQSMARRMPDALFGSLVDSCASRQPVVFVGSPSERGYYERFAGPGRMNLSGRTSLAEVTSVLRQAAGIVTTDTGLMHVAGAVNRNVTAVFGPTHPLRKCPPGARWAWSDAGRYDARYEVFGRRPRGSYFRELTATDILQRAIPTPPDAQPAESAP